MKLILSNQLILPGQNGRYFVDDLFKCISTNDKKCISIPISLKFVPTGPIDKKTALLQVMALRRIGDKSLPEPILTHFVDAYMRHWGKMS